MIKLSPVEPVGNAAWDAWKVESDTEVVRIHAAYTTNGSAPQIRDELYKRMRDVLFSLYPDKCVYCETQLHVAQGGDVEHFRPKGRVTDLSGQIVRINNKSGQITQHPGYYWLAYSWSNLFPACMYCNRPNSIEAQSFGKYDKFPLDSEYASHPGDEANETPLLLHPVLDDPASHLDFQSNGMVSPKTKRGDICVKIFGLNIRENLVKRRRVAYQEAYRRIFDMVEAARHDNDNESKQCRLSIQDIIKGRCEYAAAARVGVRDAAKKLEGIGIKIEF